MSDWKNFKLMQVYDTSPSFSVTAIRLVIGSDETVRQYLGDTAVPVAPGKQDVTSRSRCKPRPERVVGLPFDTNPLQVSSRHVCSESSVQRARGVPEGFYKAERITVNYQLQAP